MQINLSDHFSDSAFYPFFSMELSFFVAAFCSKPPGYRIPIGGGIVEMVTNLLGNSGSRVLDNVARSPLCVENMGSRGPAVHISLLSNYKPQDKLCQLFMLSHAPRYVQYENQRTG